MVKNNEKLKKKTYLVLVEFLQLLLCLEDCWHARVKINKRLFEPFCVWILF